MTLRGGLGIRRMRIPAPSDATSAGRSWTRDAVAERGHGGIRDPEEDPRVRSCAPPSAGGVLVAGPPFPERARPEAPAGRDPALLLPRRGE